MVDATLYDTRPPAWFRIAAVLALLWGLVSVFAWTADLMTDEQTAAQFTDAQRRLYLARPAWIFAVYALAIFSALAGATGLLLRRRWAVFLLALSLAALVVQFGYTFIALDAISLLGVGAAFFPLFIVAVGAAMLWLALDAQRRGWLD